MLHLAALGWRFEFSVTFASKDKPLKELVNFVVEPSSHVFREVACVNGRRLGTVEAPLFYSAPGSCAPPNL